MNKTHETILVLLVQAKAKVLEVHYHLIYATNWSAENLQPLVLLRTHVFLCNRKSQTQFEDKNAIPSTRYLLYSIST